MTATHPADAVLFAATPLQPAPRFGALAPLPCGQKRILAASDGLYVEARSHAWDLCLPIAETPLPYGDLVPRLRSPAGQVPLVLIAQFIAAAQAQPDTEIAAAIVVRDDCGFALIWPRIESASGAHVRYIDADIDDARLLCDLHSHGRAEAFFSGTDDASDLSRCGPYVAIVVGRCDTAQPQIAMRVALAPYLVPLSTEVFKALQEVA